MIVQFYGILIMESELLTIEQAAQVSGRTVNGLYAAIRRGKLAREWQEGDMRIRRAELLRYMAAAKVGRPRAKPSPIPEDT
jgi:hypothetical protein